MINICLTITFLVYLVLWLWCLWNAWWTFNYWLKSYIRFIKITSVVECLRTKLEHYLVPWVPIMNKLRTTMVRRNMICGAHELYDDVLERGVYGDCYMLHVLTNAHWKKEKFDEVKKFFEEAKGRWLELDANVYNIVKETKLGHCLLGVLF